MVEQPNIDAVILDYLRRGPASSTNVASHFCLPKTVAQHKLARMEVAGLIKRGRSFRWAALTSPPTDTHSDNPTSDCATHNGSAKHSGAILKAAEVRHASLAFAGPTWPRLEDGEYLIVPPHGWTCFHCGMTFTDFWAARWHFGTGHVKVKPRCIRRAELDDATPPNNIEAQATDMERTAIAEYDVVLAQIDEVLK